MGTGLRYSTVSRDDAVGKIKGSRKQNKKKRTNNKNKQSKNKKRKKKAISNEEDVALDVHHTDIMRKLYEAHPRHIIKLILKKLIEKPLFYRMLGSLGMALKSSNISLSEYMLSSSNKLSKSTMKKLKYDINDSRMLILARMAIHKMLIREGSTLKSLIQSNGTYPIEIDSDFENEEIAMLPSSHQSMKKGLKYINNDQFAQKLQNEKPQNILNALSFMDKHRLYKLLQTELSKEASSELHEHCTSHVTK